MNKKRPININPLSVHLPVPAWVSISHRLSGIFIFLMLPGILWMLEKSLFSAESFNKLNNYLAMDCFKIIILISTAALGFHLFAGIRHLLMDCGLGESLKGGKTTAWLVILSALGLVGLTSIWLWF